jgi:DNA invertase Pin-like site-specific DNA recombinase
MSEADAIRTIAENRGALAWGYLRISSNKQELDGCGLDVQRQDVLRYCADRGLPTPILVEEIASAGKPILNVKIPGQRPDEIGVHHRPVMEALIAILTDLSVPNRHLVVYKLDRVSRVAYEQDMLLNMLDQRGVKVHSCAAGEQSTLGEESKDPARQMMRQIMAIFAQYERAMIENRLRSGARLHASRGLWGGGRPPRGYEMKKNDIVVSDDPDDVADIQYVFYHKSAGLNMRQISEWMTMFRRRDKWQWSKMAVKRVLDNEQMCLGKYHDRFGGVHDRPELRIIPADWAVWAEQHQAGAIAS